MTTSSNQLVAVALGPAKVTTTINGIQVDVKAQTDYPFDDIITYSISVNKKANFPFCVCDICYIADIIRLEFHHGLSIQQ
jgi:hypothetical protein